MDVTVLIATRNRADSLRRTLASLGAQRTGGAFAFEILVADNGSQDHTRQVVAAAAQTIPVPVRYVCVPQPGKPHALNRGVERARGELVALTDDDVQHPPEWLARLVATMRERNADGAGGPVRPLWLSPRPAWLSDPILRQLGMSDHGAASFQLQPGSTSVALIGPNAIYRRALFARFGGYEPGHPAEDSDWCLRLLEAGCALWYQPAAEVRHAVDGQQLTPASIRRRLLVHGAGYGRRIARQRGRRLLGVPLWVIRLYLQLHLQALAARLRGDAADARWQWLRRSLYHGVMAQCVHAWMTGRASPGAPRLQLAEPG
jgi:glycosyltransferase involved in cell wall biosynthesis